jgi:hypothetical protein
VASSHDICCDLPRGEFPYLVYCNLVVFGHLIWSCVTQATLETRVCHSRAYFNSHLTPLPWFDPLLSTSSSVSFPPTTTTYALYSQCRRNHHLLPENLLLAPHKVCTCPFSTIFNGSMARMGMFVASPLEVLISPQRLGLHASITPSPSVYFSNRFLFCIIFSRLFVHWRGFYDRILFQFCLH